MRLGSAFKKPYWIEGFFWCEQLTSCHHLFLALASPRLSVFGEISATSYSVVNGHTAVHHLNQSSQPL